MARSWVTALALLALAPAAASARGVETATCSQQSKASFLSDPDDLTVGPLTFVGLRSNTVDGIRRFGGDKSQALVRPGHRVRVTIGRAARSFARLAYVHVGGRHDEDDFERYPHTVVFKACGRRRAQSRLDGRPATFWSGFFLIREAPTCLPLTIRVNRRAPRRLRLPIAGGPC